MSFINNYKETKLRLVLLAFHIFCKYYINFSISKFQMAGEAVGKSQEKIEPKKMTLEKIMPTVFIYFLFFIFIFIKL